MGEFKNKSIMIDDLKNEFDSITVSLGSFLLEMEWSSNTDTKNVMKDLIRDFGWIKEQLIATVERFYNAEYLSTDNKRNIGSAKEWGRREGSLEEAVDRILDSEKWIDEKAI